MVEVQGEKVKHKFFGVGTVLEINEKYIDIVFDNGEEKKTFPYPDVFKKFLHTESSILLEIIKKDQLRVDEKRELEKIIRLKQIEIKKTLDIEKKEKAASKNKKTQQKQNVAFKCNYCDGGNTLDIGYQGVCSKEIIAYNVKVAKYPWCSNEKSICSRYIAGELTKEEFVKRYEEEAFVCYESDMLKKWRACAGVYSRGPQKGKPMKLKNVSSNNLAILTTRLPHTLDKERFIFAVFLVEENGEGDHEDEGYVKAHSKYRVRLSLKEAKKLKFWDYYFNPNKPEKLVFGSGLHRYLTDIQSAQILEALCEIKKGTSDEKLTIELFNYYCDVKELDKNSIPKPFGGLKRI